MKFLRVSLLILCLALPATEAKAAQINKDGAAQLKTLVDNFLKEQKKLSEIDGVTKIEYQGETMVEEAGEYYAVTLPYTKIINPDGDQVDVGMISINAAQADAPGQWKMRVAVPTPIIVTDKQGREVVRLTLGGQRAAGIWDEKIQSFVKLDALYKNVEFAYKGIEFPEANSLLKIPEVQIVYDFTKDAAGKWSGPGSITLKNLVAKREGNPAASEIHTHLGSEFNAAEIKISFTIDQYNSDAINAYRKKLVAFSESINKDPAIQKGQMKPEHVAALGDMMMEFFPNAGNGVAVRYELTGFNYNSPAAAEAPVSSIQLPKAFFGMDLSGFTTGKVRLALQGGYDGLKITPVPADAELTPTMANVDITVENLPLKELLELGKNTMESNITNPAAKQFAMLSLAANIPALLSQSGAFISINNTHIGNEQFDVKIEGRARADSSAVMSGTADIKATFRNLDTLLTGLKEKSKTLQGGDLQKIQTGIAQLEQIKTMARVEKGADGQTVHVLDFSVTPQGKILLNGEDMSQPKQGLEKPAPVPAP